MEIDIKRGYEILPDNNIVFGIRITNNTNLVISDVQVILDYNESLFKLHKDRILKLGNIPPSTALTAKFTLKPTGRIHSEKIEASIIYRDPKWEKHIVDMRPMEIQQSNTHSTRISEISQSNNNGKDAKKDGVAVGKYNRSLQDEDVARMYDRYLKEIESKQSGTEEKSEASIIPHPRNPYPSDKKLSILRSTAPPRKKEETNLEGNKKSKKEVPRQMLYILIFFIIAGSLMQVPIIKENIVGKYGIVGTNSNETELIVTNFLNAVNGSQFSIAFNMYQGEDVLVPASIQMLFSNGGIKPDSIKQIDIVSNEIEDDTAVIAVNCTVSSFNILGKETDISLIPVYFQLHDIEQGWTITSVSFSQPFNIESSKTADVIQQ
ncbi:hypothetical protein RE476_10665 [Methanolobus mangrovi]|uniref:Uncharacterized protein n=1 Tax=Methanolobus mangrovi TaxID=3072977 RepID=A0AA51YGB9_9EURY|nr:hypothetical protein [Methanolobus mangrovi]WMW21827.1 hypothetical protein RE476_10665 [Methanolobus mangrovi]